MPGLRRVRVSSSSVTSGASLRPSLTHVPGPFLPSRCIPQCNRSHTVADVGTAVEALSQAGISNWSADLLSGLPRQDTAHWERTLDEVLRQFAPPHLSVYGLQIEENTRFKRLLDKGTLALPTEAQAVEMYGTTCEVCGNFDIIWDHFSLFRTLFPALTNPTRAVQDHLRSAYADRVLTGEIR